MSGPNILWTPNGTTQRSASVWIGKSFSEQAFPGTIDVMAFWLRKLLDGLHEQVMLPEVIEPRQVWTRESKES